MRTLYISVIIEYCVLNSNAYFSFVSVEGLQELCQDDDFICHSKYRCIPLNATCNGIIDCMEDGSDENELFCCECPWTSLAFSCQLFLCESKCSKCNHRLTNMVWVLTRRILLGKVHFDLFMSLVNRECPASYFRCTDAQGLHRCIEMHHVCDGAIDCADASDEEFCPCHEDEFRCNNGMCIKAKYRCDHDSDCPDHSDEIGCSKLSLHQVTKVKSNVQSTIIKAASTISYYLCTLFR